MRKVAVIVALFVAWLPPLAAEPMDGSPELIAHMHEHMSAVNKIKAAIIRGDLPATREPARWLAEHPTPASIPQAWVAHVEGLRFAARDAIAATDFEAAATAASLMAESCGSCHIANNVTDRFQSAAVPSDELDSMAHMQRHQWAADRMWEGIVGPSDIAWGEGTDLLLETPLTAGEMDTQDDSIRTVRRMARRVHELAAHGMVEQDLAARADIYAEFLATCAACHKRLGQGPKP